MHNINHVNNRRNVKSVLTALIICILVAVSCVIPVHAETVNVETETAETVYTNPDTGYVVVTDDEALLLSAGDLSALTKIMKNITNYGNVAFKTLSVNFTTTANFAENYYYETFGSDSGVVFIIDMDNREIYIYSDGAVYNTITSSYAYTITDNVYTYASDGDYYVCAYRAYEQMLNLLEGQHIAQPMKYISNALLALILALLINYFIAKVLSNARKATDSQLLEGVAAHCSFNHPQAHYTHQTRTYSPRKSSSGGGRSGGGRSGGGGGHRF